MWSIQILVLVLLLSGAEVVTSAEDCRNVGTTLFDPAALLKECWGPDTMALLEDRLVAEELLPDDDKLPRICSEYVASLLEYIFVALEAVGSTMTGFRLHTMSLACADVFGGFLYSEVLPRARMEYYAGNLPHADMCTLYDILDRFRTLLRTNGRYWKPPDVVSRYPPADPIQIPSSCANECSKLITYPNSNSSSFIIPLPFIDDKFQPCTVAVPYKERSLYQLEAPYSAMVVARFYVTSMKCLKEKSSPQDEVNGFCEYLYVWLVKDVLPLLPNQQWYTAFGSVLRILESMKQMGIAKFSDGKFLLPEHKTKFNKPGSINLDCYKPSPPPPPPPQSQPQETTLNLSSLFSRKPRPDDSSSLDFLGVSMNDGMATIVLVAVGTAVAMWLIMLLLLCCCRCAKSRAGGGTFYNVFVSFFYMIRDTLHAASSIKTGAEDVERQPLKSKKGNGNVSSASSAGKMAKEPSNKSSSSHTGPPSSGRAFNPYEDQIMEAQEEDESVSESTTDSDTEEYYQGSNNSGRRKVTSS